jgi:hypothetical protein
MLYKITPKTDSRFIEGYNVYFDGDVMLSVCTKIDGSVWPPGVMEIALIVGGKTVYPVVDVKLVDSGELLEIISNILTTKPGEVPAW